MKKILILLVALLIPLAGCQEKNLETSIPKPQFSLRNQKIDAVTGSYTWSEGGSAAQADKGSAPELAKKKKAIEVAENDTIKLDFSKKPTAVQAGVWDYKKEKTVLKDAAVSTFEVPALPEGEHFILIHANFSNGNADYVFKINVVKEEKIVTDFAYPQLLPEERHTYSMLAIGPRDEKEPIESNEKIIKYVNEILSLENGKQASTIYPMLELKSDPCYVLFNQKGPVFQSSKLPDLIDYIASHKP